MFFCYELTAVKVGNNSGGTGASFAGTAVRKLASFRLVKERLRRRSGMFGGGSATICVGFELRLFPVSRAAVRVLGYGLFRARI
jgi:hypothetical protein